MTNIKEIIKTFPLLYNVLKRLYIIPHLRKWAVEWKARTFDGKAKFWYRKDIGDIEKYWSGKDDASNEYLVEKLKQWEFDSILEIGSNCGNRLYNLSRLNRDTKIVGIDINPIAISEGNEWLRNENIENVTLLLKRAEELNDFSDNSFDIVFSWATLIYVRPKLIQDTLKNMLRIARKAVILIEMQGSCSEKDPYGLGVYCEPGNWKRDYVHLFRDLYVEEKNIFYESVPENIWKPGGGGAAYIEAHKKEIT